MDHTGEVRLQCASPLAGMMLRVSLTARLLRAAVAAAAVVVASVAACVGDACAQSRISGAAGPGAGYMRTRPGAASAGHWTGYGGRRGFAPNGFYGYGAPFYAAEFSGHWYARPYPYHFDYYRNRWPAAPTTDGDDDCPCAVVVEEAPATAPTLNE
jgi:hypothetical protein